MYSQYDIDNFIQDTLIYRKIHHSMFEYKMKDSSLVLQLNDNGGISFKRYKSMIDTFTKAMKHMTPKNMIIGLVLTKGKCCLMGLNMEDFDKVEGNINVPIYIEGKIHTSVLNGKKMRNEVDILMKRRYIYFFDRWNEDDHKSGSLSRMKLSTIY